MGPRNLASDFNRFPYKSQIVLALIGFGSGGCGDGSTSWDCDGLGDHSWSTHPGKRDPPNITSGEGGQEVALTPTPNKHPRQTDMTRQHRYPSAPLPSPPSSTTEPASPRIPRERPYVTLGLWGSCLPWPGSGPGQEGWGALHSGAPGLPAPHLEAGGALARE